MSPPPSPPLCSHSGLNLRYQTILLSGPSGCGKMTVVESVARLCGLHVVVVSCGWVGVGVAGGCVQCGPFLLQCNPIGTTGVKDSVSGSIADGEYACLPPPLSSRHLPPLPPLTPPPSSPSLRCAAAEASCPCVLVIRGVHGLNMSSSAEPNTALHLSRLLEVLPTITEYHQLVSL